MTSRPQEKDRVHKRPKKKVFSNLASSVWTYQEPKQKERRKKRDGRKCETVKGMMEQDRQRASAERERER